MRATNRCLAATLVAGMVLAGGCAGNGQDAGDGPDQVLQVDSITIPPASTIYDPDQLMCVTQFAPATVILRNQHKTEIEGGSPFNDIVMDTVTITYTWDNPAVQTPPQTLDIGGVVGAGKTATISFVPIPSGQFTPAMVGATVSMDMKFNGHMESGEPVVADGGGSLTINPCLGG